jgi:hypothetical protein
MIPAKGAKVQKNAQKQSKLLLYTGNGTGYK